MNLVYRGQKYVPQTKSVSSKEHVTLKYRGKIYTS